MPRFFKLKRVVLFKSVDLLVILVVLIFNVDQQRQQQLHFLLCDFSNSVALSGLLNKRLSILKRVLALNFLKLLTNCEFGILIRFLPDFRRHGYVKRLRESSVQSYSRLNEQ